MRWSAAKKGAEVPDFTESTSVDPVVGEVLALRSFRIDPLTRTLGGLYFRQEVAPGVNLAQCGLTASDGGHTAPHAGCSCGWYAYDEVRHWIGSSPPRRPVGWEVSAVVRLSGRIIVCERGLKAEGMEVVAVAVDPSCAGFIHDALPGVEVFADEASMLRAHPLQRLDREAGDGMGGRTEINLAGLTIPVAKPLRALSRATGRVKSARATLTSNMAFWSAWNAAKWLLAKMATVTVWVAILWLVKALFPPENLGGFGAFVPFGVLLLLSPLLDLWRSVQGVLVYLALLTYGFLGSADVIERMSASLAMTEAQVTFIVASVYMGPLALVLIRSMRHLFRSSPSVATGRVMSGNHLPRKVKSGSPRGGDDAPEETTEGGQHG